VANVSPATDRHAAPIVATVPTDPAAPIVLGLQPIDAAESVQLAIEPARGDAQDGEIAAPAGDAGWASEFESR